MNKLTFATKTALLALAASTMTLWANGPMATTPSRGNTTPTRSNATPTRSNPVPRTSNSGRGVTVCYDYAYWRATGRTPNGSYLGPDDLRNDRSVRTRTVYTNPAEARYRPQDWILTSGGHAGYVNNDGTIDHFLQLNGRTGIPYPDPNFIPSRGTFPGGLSRNNTMEQFLNSGYIRRPNVSVEVLGRGR